MITLEAQPRDAIGKGLKALRRRGLLPAVVYGAKTASRPLALPLKEFQKALAAAGESSLLLLRMNGQNINVLIHDVAVDPLTEVPLHADFLAVEMDKEVHIKVELEFIGESPAVKVDGGVLVKVVHELEVAALPKDLPSSIAVDLSGLSLVGGKISVGDLLLPAGVKSLAPLDEVIVIVEPPRSEEELKSLEAEPAPTAEVETEQEIKRKAEKAEAQTAEET